MSERSEHTSHIIVNLNFRAKNASSILESCKIKFQAIYRFSLRFSFDFLQFDFIN